MVKYYADSSLILVVFLKVPATPELNPYGRTIPLHDALPIGHGARPRRPGELRAGVHAPPLPCRCRLTRQAGPDRRHLHEAPADQGVEPGAEGDRKSTRLNSSH